MSSILTVTVEILLDVFRANDPAGTEALRLTCRRFNSLILQNVDTLPTRLVCDLRCHLGVALYQTPANNESTRDEFGRESRKPIAGGIRSPRHLQHFKTAIQNVEIRTGINQEHLLDEPLTQLAEHFPSVKRAVSLNISSVTVPPSDAVLDRYERLEMIGMNTCVVICWDDEDPPSFWHLVFARKAFRRVSTFVIWNDPVECPEVDDRELFDFITDCSLMPAGKPRVVSIGRLPDGRLDPLKRRFDENIASIGGQVCAVIADHEYDEHCLTNMASGSENETLARQLLRDVRLPQPD